MDIQLQTQKATQVLQTGFTDIAQDSKKIEFNSNNGSLLSIGKELTPLPLQNPVFGEDTLVVTNNTPFTITKEALLANDTLNGITVGRVAIYLEEFNPAEASNGLTTGRSANDSLTMTPSQQKTFGSYTVYDTNDKFIGASNFNVDFQLNGSGVAPIANDDLINIKGVQSIDGKYNSFRERSYTGRDTISYVKLDVLENDAGSNLKIVDVDSTGKAQFGFSPINIKVENGDIFIAPKAGFKGNVSFDYTISDGINGFSKGNITLNIDPNLVIAPPAPITPPAPIISIAKDDIFAGRQNAITRFTVNDLLSNDTGVSFDSISEPSDGTLFTSRDGQSFTYLPNDGFVGQDTFEYTTKNKAGETITAKVIIDIPFPTATAPVINSIYSMV
jgi:hypothetical protein